MWVYRLSVPGLWLVGFYKPDGEWVSESEHPDGKKAAARVHYLNGGLTAVEPVKVESMEEVLAHESLFIQQFNRTIRELRNLVNTWNVGGWSAEDKLVKSYPVWMPSLDELVEDFANIMDE